MKANLNFWKSIGASRWVLEIIDIGYHLPFVKKPTRAYFPNHKSALDNYDFVVDAINEMLCSGAVEEVHHPQDIYICNPLGVVPMKKNKLRLILDLRYLNQHLATTKFKYEDMKVASQILHKGDWFFTFDLKSGYHHIDSAESHKCYLGFSFVIGGFCRHFVFASLPFGLSTAPFCFHQSLTSSG